MTGFRLPPEWRITESRNVNNLLLSVISSIGKVEVVAKGKTFKEERLYSRGASVAGAAFTDEELAEKFKYNASRVLTPSKIKGAVKTLLSLESVDNVSELVKQVTA